MKGVQREEEPVGEDGMGNHVEGPRGFDMKSHNKRAAMKTNMDQSKPGQDQNGK